MGRKGGVVAKRRGTEPGSKRGRGGKMQKGSNKPNEDRHLSKVSKLGKFLAR